MMNIKPEILVIKPMKVIYIQVIEKYGSQKLQEAWPRLFDFFNKNKS